MSALSCVIALGSAPASADPAPLPLSTEGPIVATGAAVAAKPVIEQVPKIEVPPNGTVNVPRGPSLAARPVEARPVGPEPPQVTIPAGPTLFNQLDAAAKARLASHGLVTDGKVDPDVRKYMPATDQAGILDLPGPVAGLVDQAAAKVKELSGFDLMALYHALPEGIPLITYRLCAETATRSVSCSVPRPIVVPVVADVTGDGTPDVLADLVPALDINLITAAANALNSTQQRLNQVIKDIGAIVNDPLKLLELLNLKKQLEKQLAQQRYDLGIQITAGLGLLSARLPTSETVGGELKAQLWAQYDIPASLDFSTFKRLSIGFDGYRRGTSLSTLDWGVYTVDPIAATRGIVDVRASLCRFQPGTAIATVAGLADLESKQLVEPTLASLRQSPVPQRFTARARFDTGRIEGKLEITSSQPAVLDGLILTNKAEDQFTEIYVNQLPAQVTAEFTRNTKNGEADVHFTSSAAIEQASVHNYLYTGERLDKVAEGALTKLPTDIHAHYASTDGKNTTLDVDANAPLAKTLDATYFDRAADKTIVKAGLTDLPAQLKLAYDHPASHITATTDSKIGRITALVQRNEGAISAPAGDHVTLIKDAAVIGAAATISGLAGFDVTYGGHPHALLTLNPGGQAFSGAADIDGTHLARVAISNLPASVEVDLDPAARTAKYRAASVINSLRAAYTNVKSGPTVDGTLTALPASVDASWTLGDKTVVDVTTSTSLKKIDFYVNKAYVTQVSPTSGEDLQATVDDIPTHITVTADMVAKHLDWTADKPVTSVFAFARVNAQGSYFRVAAKVATVPARFEADWGDGAYRFTGVSGPIGSATIAATNHDGALAPSGPHLAAHFRESDKQLDASVRIDGLSNVEFSKQDTGFTADFQAARQVVALDADLYLAGGLRFGGLGTLGPIPGHIGVSAAKGGVISYNANGDSLDLKADVWLGKAAGIPDGAPGFANGIALVEGSGGSQDDGPFCTARGCFGVRGFISLSGLPSAVTVDLAKKTFTFSGYRPKVDELKLYVAGKILPPVPIKALATLTGLPQQITTVEIGDFDAGKGSIKANYKIEPVATLPKVEVVAESEIPDFGVVRGQIVIDKVPAAFSVDGTYGKETSIKVDDSAAVDKLLAKVTVDPDTDGRGTGVIEFTDVPAAFTIGANVTGKGLQVPNFTYGSAASTLDGLFGLQGALLKKFIDRPEGELIDATFQFTDLAGDTTVKVNEDLSIDMVSKPQATKLVELHAGLIISPVAKQPVFVRKDIPYTAGFFAFQLDGDYKLDKSRLGDFGIAVHDINTLRIKPGKVPFGLEAPAALGFVFPGFEGDYGTLDLGVNDLDLKHDVTLNVKIDRDLGPDAFNDTLRLLPATTVQLHRYDQQMRDISSKLQFKVGIDLFCLSLSTKPGFVPPKSTNTITLKGADGQQMVTLLDPDDQVQDYIIDLFAHFMSPFDGADWAVHGFDPGSCEQLLK
ncbi:hypothetical protein [Nonomuraea sp. NPDC049784]|uniref:hypothetical protein n=1 Tax=Nonomuraea sp. NPDC049784 TaxID=3154361 RepID=UPI003406D2D0